MILKSIAERVFAFLTLPGLRTTWAQQVIVEDKNEIQSNLAGIRPNQRVDVFVGEKAHLKRQLTIPRSGRSNLGQIVDMNMRQSLPGGGKDMIWTYVVKPTSGSNVKVDVLVLKRDFISSLEAEIKERRATLRSVYPLYEGASSPFTQAHRSTDRPLVTWIRLSATGVLVIAIASAWLTLQTTRKWDAHLAEVTNQQNNLLQKATDIAEQKKKASARKAQFDQDIAILSHDRTRLTAILEISDIFDENTWISELIFQGDQMRISGLSKGDVLTMQSELARAEWIASVDLIGPIQFDSFEQTNRFEFSAKTIVPGSK